MDPPCAEIQASAQPKGEFHTKLSLQVFLGKSPVSPGSGAGQRWLCWSRDAKSFLCTHKEAAGAEFCLQQEQLHSLVPLGQAWVPSFLGRGK